jgi:type IV secretion system protein TrbH
MASPSIQQTSLVVILWLGACASSQAPKFGNFAHATSATEAAMAEDAARLLVELYPPATTALHLQHRMSDPFGRTLVSLLRDAGYSVSEHGVPSPPNALPVHYVIAPVSRTLLLQLSVRVGTTSLSRAYQAFPRTARAAGTWNHQSDTALAKR